MATSNGAVSHAPIASPDSSSVTGKRKRSSSPDKVINNIPRTEDVDNSEQFEKDLSMLLKITEGYDGILSKPVPRQDGDDDRSTKRAKLSDGKEMGSVQSRIQAGLYSSIESVIDDIRVIIDEDSKMVNGLADGVHKTSSAEGASDQGQTKYSILRKILDKFASERLLQGRRTKSEVREERGISQAPDADSTKTGIVLTLFGNTDRGPRQLFSSLQVPQIDRLLDATNASERKHSKIDESFLPNGITATKVVPFNAQSSTSDKKETPKFGQVFKAHHTIKPLEPPKATTTSGSSALSWVKSHEDHFKRAKPLDRSDYKFAQLPAGQWLRYKGFKNVAEVAGHNGQLHRDKEMATNDRTAANPETLKSLARERALFQSVYSSFAPAYDDGDAIIPSEVRNQVWWKKSGKAQFEALLCEDDQETEEVDIGNADSQTAAQSAADDFSEAVASFTAEQEPSEVQNDGKVDDKEVDDILDEISDQLNTLSSYQRIRQSTVPSQKAPSGDQGTFSEPSTTESDIYSILKSQLSIMISTLPPYAVAKLDGDQLRQLEIGTNILTSQDDYAGVMEVDEFTFARQKAAASANAAIARPGASAQSRPSSYTSNSTPGIYNQRAYSANTRPPTAATPFSRPAYAGATPSQNYATAGRPTPQTVSRYGGQPTSYTGSPSVQQFQRPLPNGYSGAYNSHQQAQNAVAAYIHRPSQPGYQQRAQDNAARSTSPSKPGESQSRPQYPGSATPGQQPRYFQQASAQPGIQGSPSPHPQTPGMTPLDRARLQAQQYASQQQRPPSTTPQAGNSQIAERSNTPGGGQQNGIGVPATPVPSLQVLE